MDLLELAELVERGGSEGCHEMFAEALLPKDAQKDTKLYRRYRALMQGALKGSIDAVETIRVQLLPYWETIVEPKHGRIRAITYLTGTGSGMGHSKKEPLARLAAFLRAVHAEREEK